MAFIEHLLSTLGRIEFWILLVITFLIYRYVMKKRYNLPPLPQGWPIIGNFFSLPKGAQLYKWSRDQSRIHGSVIRYTLVVQDVVILNDIDSTHKAMVEKAMDFAGRPESVLFDIGSEGYQDVAFAQPDSPFWKERRKLLSLSLRNFSQGKPHERRVNECFVKLAEMLDIKAQIKEAFDPMNYCKLFMYNQIAAMCFQKSYGLEDQEFKLLTKSFEDANAEFGSGFTLSDVVPFTNYLPFEMPDKKRIKAMMAPVFDFIAKEIDEHWKNLNVEDIGDLTHYVMKLMKEDETYKELTPIQFKQIISDVFAAGVDTSQITLRWLILSLAIHEDVQEKIYQESLEVLGPVGDDGVVVSSSEHKSKMPFSEAVLLESTRWGTGAPFGLPHRTLCDTKIDDYDIPANTMVLINQWAINNDERYNKTPEKFIPERFLKEDGSLGPRPKSFLPFGLGRRICPGESAARNTLWMTMVLLVRRYKIVPPNGVTLKPKARKSSFDGTPENYEIVFELRENN